jgi:hypothetical protein
MAEYKGNSHEGDRAARILKKMEKRKEELEAQKEKIRKVCYARCYAFSIAC